MERRPNGTYINWATQDLKQRYGYKITGTVIDQHRFRLGATVESPSGKPGWLLVGGYAVRVGGYTKSLDAQIVLEVIKKDEYLLLGLNNENKFYMTTGEDLKRYLDETDRVYNGVRSLKECLSVNPPLCPICKEKVELNKNKHVDHPASLDSRNLIEVHNWRIKFCNIPLREADFVNIDRTVGIKASKYEKWLDSKLKEHGLRYLRTAEFRDPIIKKQFGFYPDFIPLPMTGNLVIEVDVSTQRKTIEKRKELLKKRGYRLYSVRNLPQIYKEYEKGNDRKLKHLISVIKMHLNPLTSIFGGSNQQSTFEQE